MGSAETQGELVRMPVALWVQNLAAPSTAHPEKVGTIPDGNSKMPSPDGLNPRGLGGKGHNTPSLRSKLSPPVTRTQHFTFYGVTCLPLLLILSTFTH